MRERRQRPQDFWHVVDADGQVIAGPFADRPAAPRLAESFGPDHLVTLGALLPTMKPSPPGPT